MSVYIDTSAWIALQDAKDTNHASAQQHLRRLAASGERLLCGWHTIVEFADGLVRHFGQKVAVQAVSDLQESPRLRIEASEPHRDAAVAMFSRYKDWNVALSDFQSFAMMKTLQIERAFTYDADFKKAGFQVEG